MKEQSIKSLLFFVLFLMSSQKSFAMKSADEQAATIDASFMLGLGAGIAMIYATQSLVETSSPQHEEGASVYRVTDLHGTQTFEIPNSLNTWSEINDYVSRVYGTFYPEESHAYSSSALDFSSYKFIRDSLFCLDSIENQKDAEKFRNYFLSELVGLQQHDSSQNLELYAAIENIVLGLSTIKMNDLIGVINAIDRRCRNDNITNREDKITDLFSQFILGKKKVPNMMFVGATRAGRSTLLSTLIDPFNPALFDPALNGSISSSSLFSHTVNTKIYYAVFDGEEEFEVARLIDTPGLGEVRSVNSDSAARSDEEIIQNIAKSVEGLSLDKVILMFPHTSKGLDPLNVKALKLLSEKLKKFNVFDKRIDLAFPRADQNRLDHLQSLVAELLSNGSLLDKDCYGEIFYTGTFFNRDFEDGDLESTLVAANRVLRLRNHLLNKLFHKDHFNEYQNLNGSKLTLSNFSREKIETIIPKHDDDLEQDFFGLDF